MVESAGLEQKNSLVPPKLLIDQLAIEAVQGIACVVSFFPPSKVSAEVKSKISQREVLLQLRYHIFFYSSNKQKCLIYTSIFIICICKQK